MKYKQYHSVASGIRGQLDACATALDDHDDLPPELESVRDLLETLISSCDEVVAKAEAEPDEIPDAPSVIR